jgi:thiol-disulfide isomerase/thioredoxin
MMRYILFILSFTALFVACVMPPAISAGDDEASGFPKFKLENLKGDDVSSDKAFADADLILIDFFTYYCKPCKKLMPYVDEFQKEYGDYGFKAILFNEDEPEGIPLTKTYMKQQKYSFEVLFDVEGKVESFFSITAQPTTIMLDSEGNIVHRHEGYNKGDEEGLDAFIRKFLEDKGNIEKSK